MNPWMLTSDALREPWRLWSCHLIHHSWQHAADNFLALSIPLLLAQRKDRSRVLLWLFLLAPVLSLALLPALNGETFCGFSGLACAAWIMVGLQLLLAEDSLPVGFLMVGLLGLKFTVEAMTGTGLLQHDGRWQTISESHLYGTLMGIGASLLDDDLRRMQRKMIWIATIRLRKLVTIPR